MLERALDIGGRGAAQRREGRGPEGPAARGVGKREQGGARAMSLTRRGEARRCACVPAYRNAMYRRLAIVPWKWMATGSE
ncbi:hypothetical protein CMUS01_09184 [Colletotrichum musicola]|uniref:Uncharacterized protein n=1 Tax=Colletotrichum musicola TaxID=2175873 RepID=A0A8H6NC01_9PEZI|nr:hypothetical protein CMUS01_09184 [Colletotrichum musicola]